MQGLTYYPPKEQVQEIVDENIEDLKLFIDKKGKSSNEIWDEIKKNSLTNECFFVDKDVPASCGKMIEELSKGNLPYEYFFYNTKRLFDLLCDYSYAVHHKDLFGRDIIIDYVKDLTRKGVNLEEIKMLVYSVLVFDMDSIIERGDLEITQGKIDSSLRLIWDISKLQDISPYESPFLYAGIIDQNQAKGVNNDKMIDQYISQLLKFDAANLRYIALCKMKNYFLNALTKIKLQGKFNSDLARTIFEEREPFEIDDDKYAIKSFRYTLSEEFKPQILKMVADMTSQPYFDLASEFYKSHLTTDADAGAYDAAHHVLADTDSRIKLIKEQKEKKQLQSQDKGERKPNVLDDKESQTAKDSDKQASTCKDSDDKSQTNNDNISQANNDSKLTDDQENQ